MKYKLFRFVLQCLRKVALITQIGNPAKKAPVLIDATEKEGPYGFKEKDFENIFVWRLRNITCSGLSGGALINKYNQAYRRFLDFPWGPEVHPALSLPYLGKRHTVCSNAIFLLTPAATSNYYHWMVDCLPRILLVKKSGSTDLDTRTIILHSSGKRYETDTLEVLKVDLKRVVRIRPFQFVSVNDLVVPDFLCSHDGNPFPNWKKSLLDDFKNMVLETIEIREDTRKIFLVRGKQKTRNLIGEDKLISILKNKGFEIINPAEMSLKEQISALSGARMVVALHGAALTNIIFCPENTAIIELRSTHAPPEYFSEIAKTYNFRFETFSIPPEKIIGAPHHANEQNLILTQESIEQLSRLVEEIEK